MISDVWRVWRPSFWRDYNRTFAQSVRYLLVLVTLTESARLSLYISSSPQHVDTLVSLPSLVQQSVAAWPDDVVLSFHSPVDARNTIRLSVSRRTPFALDAPSWLRHLFSFMHGFLAQDASARPMLGLFSQELRPRIVFTTEARLAADPGEWDGLVLLTITDERTGSLPHARLAPLLNAACAKLAGGWECRKEHAQSLGDLLLRRASRGRRRGRAPWLPSVLGVLSTLVCVSLVQLGASISLAAELLSAIALLPPLLLFLRASARLDPRRFAAGWPAWRLLSVLVYTATPFRLLALLLPMIDGWLGLEEEDGAWPVGARMIAHLTLALAAVTVANGWWGAQGMAPLPAAAEVAAGAERAAQAAAGDPRAAGERGEAVAGAAAAAVPGELTRQVEANGRDAAGGPRDAEWWRQLQPPVQSPAAVSSAAGRAGVAPPGSHAPPHASQLPLEYQLQLHAQQLCLAQMAWIDDLQRAALKACSRA